MNKLLLTISVLWLYAGCSPQEITEKTMGEEYHAVWQWRVSVGSVVSSETNDHPEAYLWIPERCEQVKGVVFTQNNMIEEGIMEHPGFRKTMRELGLAQVWINPSFTVTFDFHKDAPADFQYIMEKLAGISGYKELATAPVIPMGHSALASFPWNFAAWNPDRTLALISIHGDAPQTNLTGSGRPNPNWESRNIDGVPALFVMGEFEWWEDRIAPAYAYIKNHPGSIITLFADAGHGHFDYSDDLVDYVSLFIRKAVENRLSGGNVLLNPISPQSGWLMDKWRKDSLPQAKSAPFVEFDGERQTASWVFDEEMARRTEDFYAEARGKKEQYIGISQEGEILQPKETHANYQLSFKPLEDGMSFGVNMFFADSTRMNPVSRHASTPLLIDRITGPVQKINDTTFRISFGRLGFNNSKRSNDIWLLAHNKGDGQYKSTVQQMQLRFPLFNTEGKSQQINFPAIDDQKEDIKSLRLKATSNAGVLVQYYVKEGPAYVDANRLCFTPIPPKTKFPVKITVVAWQYGKAGHLKSADPVARSFYLKKGWPTQEEKNPSYDSVEYYYRGRLKLKKTIIRGNDD